MKLFAFLVLTYLSSTCLSQKYNFNNYTVEDGLAQSQINDISQDELGYLWIGTESGLSRFDGIQFVNFSMDDGLPDNKIEKIFVDENNTLWIGTPRGIAYLKNGRFFPYLFKKQRRINDFVNFKGKLFIGTSIGLIEFSNNNFKEIRSRGDEQINIRSLVTYKDSVIICGSRTGIYSWNEKYTKFQDTTLQNINVMGLALQNKNLIISTYYNGLFNYSIEENKLWNYNLNLSRIRSIYADDDLILCPTNNGVIEIQNNTTFYYNEKNGLINETIRCTFRDKENNYWFGTDGNGLLKFLNKSIISYSREEGLSSNLVMSITQDADSNFFFGTYGDGITTFNKNLSIEYINADNGLPNNSIWSTYFDNKNRHWIATSKGISCRKDGLYILPNVTKQITTKIRCITGRKSVIYFGGTNGMYKYQNDSVHFIEATRGLNINSICIYKDNIYIASKTGLYKLSIGDKNSNLIRLNNQEETVNTIIFDQQSNLWIGTNNGLKIRLKDGITIPIILDQEEFKSKTIYGLLKSKEGDVWVSTMNGVYQITNQANKKYSIKHYGSAEGLINLELNHNAIYEDYNKNIWIGTSNGLARIDPSLNRELFDFKKPMLHMTGIKLFMEDFDYDRFDVTYEEGAPIPNKLILPFNQNHITFNFFGINLKDPESVLYEYRLIGTSKIWSPLSKTNSATYSSISPGAYTFEVRATNNSHEWSQIESIELIIRPPFWKSTWFILLGFLTTGIIILLLFQVRISSIKQKQENEKLGYKNRLLFLEQQSLNASMNRHFIFNSLNSIQYFINSSDKRSANKYLSSFAKLIRQNLDSSTANNFVVTLQEEIDRIILYLTLEKMRFQEKFDYKITIESELDTERTEIPSMILQPYVENAIIHGVLPLEKKGNIEIKIYEEFGEVVFEVIDDGIGIENTLKTKKEATIGDHESKGMEITNRRIELLRKLTKDNLLLIGPFQLNNEAGECLGTKVIIKMGIKKE